MYAPMGGSQVPAPRAWGAPSGPPLQAPPLQAMPTVRTAPPQWGAQPPRPMITGGQVNPLTPRPVGLVGMPAPPPMAIGRPAQGYGPLPGAPAGLYPPKPVPNIGGALSKWNQFQQRRGAVTNPRLLRPPQQRALQAMPSRANLIPNQLAVGPAGPYGMQSQAGGTPGLMNPVMYNRY